MKRDAHDNDFEVPPKKIQRADLSNISVRFLIPARAAGLVIGKGGENIKKIRAQYSVKLNIPDTRGTERVFTVDGALPDICNVWRDIMPKVKEVMSAKLSDPKVIMGQQRLPRRKRNLDDNGDGNGEQGEAGEEPEEEEDTMVDLRILIHQSIAGCIIGKGGDRIRELRQKHKMRVIKVYQMLAPGSSDRVVQLIAEAENAIQCMEAIVEVAENTSIRGPTEHYDAANCSEADALTYGGWLSPEGLRALSQGMHLGGGGYMGGGGGGGYMGGGRPGGVSYSGARGPPQMYDRRPGPPQPLHYQHQQMYRHGLPPPQRATGAWGYGGDGGYPQPPLQMSGYDASMHMQPPPGAAYGAQMQQNPVMQSYRPGPVPPPMAPTGGGGGIAQVTAQQTVGAVQQQPVPGGPTGVLSPYGVPPPQASVPYGYQQMPAPGAYPPAGGW